MKTSRSICIKGKLIDFDTPKVMGIINVTPDSFYAGSRVNSLIELEERIGTMLKEGVDIFDLGGYSSRPGAEDVTPDEEYSRLASGLEVLKRMAPEAMVSVDTFRASVASRCIEEWDVDIINDIGGGDLDPEIWDMVADTGVGYVLMHMRGNPGTMQGLTDYTDVSAEVLSDLSKKLIELRDKGVANVIVDPGFGFAKTLEQNYQLLADLDEFHQLNCPVLAGVSRKSMIWRPLGITPSEAANGTTVLNTVALMNGADILRVHDVAMAKEAVSLMKIYGSVTD